MVLSGPFECSEYSVTNKKGHLTVKNRSVDDLFV